jgi:hypothetical protein
VVRDGQRNAAEQRACAVMQRTAFVVTGLLMLTATPALTQGQPPFRCAVGGTFALHAMPRLGGVVKGFNVGLFQAIARQTEARADDRQRIVVAPDRGDECRPVRFPLRAHNRDA